MAAVECGSLGKMDSTQFRPKKESPPRVQSDDPLHWASYKRQVLERCFAGQKARISQIGGKLAGSLAPDPSSAFYSGQPEPQYVQLRWGTPFEQKSVH